MKATPIWLSLFLLLSISSYGQELIGAHATYDDSFREWDIVPAYDSLEIGKLELSWPYNDKWDKWEYQVADHSGHIRLKWINKANEWELVDGSDVVNMRPVWKGDLSEWRITHNGNRYTYRSKNRNIANIWQTRGNKDIYFDMMAEYEGDPRDWIIEDTMQEETPLAVKMAMIFITVYYTTPRK